MAVRVTDEGEWDAVTLRRLGTNDGLRLFGDSRVTHDVVICYKKVKDRWVPWTFETTSAFLESRNVKGRGLYTLQQVNPSRQTILSNTTATRVGRYSGEVVAEFGNLDSPEARASIQALAKEGRTSMLAMRLGPNNGGPWSIVDGQNAMPPLVPRANDPRDRNLANTRFTANGFMEGFNKTTHAANLSSATSLDHIAKSELLVTYEAGGRGYWRTFVDLGSERNPYEFDQSPGPLLAMSMASLQQTLPGADAPCVAHGAARTTIGSRMLPEEGPPPELEGPAPPPPPGGAGGPG